MPCGELCGKYDIGQATMWHHVKELENAGLIRASRSGKTLRPQASVTQMPKGHLGGSLEFRLR
jgi:predicted transcriptional regulator